VLGHFHRDSVSRCFALFTRRPVRGK
jgi:hypothetical protein